MKVEKYLFFFLILLTFSSASSQFMMQGRVLEVNSGSKGLSGVKVFSKYSVDTVLTDSEGYFNINLSEQSYLAVAGLSFAKRSFLVNNPGALFDYKVGDELTVHMVDVVKREKLFHHLTETWWNKTRENLLVALEDLDSTSKTFFKNKTSLIYKSHQSDVFYQRALKYLAYLNLDELPSRYQELLTELHTGGLDKSSIEGLKAASSKEKSIKQVFTNLDQAVNLKLDPSKCNCYCMSTLEHNGFSSYVGRIPPYNSTKIGLIKSEISYKNLVKNLSFYSKGRSESIDPQRLQKAWEVLVELKKINNTILLEEEMLIRALAIDNIPFAGKKKRNDFFTPQATVDYLLQLKAEHTDFFNIEISNLSHISMELDFHGAGLGGDFMELYESSVKNYDIPVHQQLGTLQFLNTYFKYVPDKKVVSLLLKFEKLNPYRDYQGRGQYFLTQLCEEYLKKGDWAIADTLASLYTRKRNRIYDEPDHTYFLNRYYYLKAMRLWQEGDLTKARDNFSKFEVGFIRLNGAKKNGEYWEGNVDILDNMRFMLLNFSDSDDLDKLEKLVKFCRDINGIERFKKIKKTKGMFLEIREFENELAQDLSLIDRKDILLSMDELWDEVIVEHDLIDLKLKKYENQFQLAKINLFEEPKKTISIIDQLTNSFSAQDLEIDQQTALDFELQKALAMCLINNWRGAKVIFKEFKSLSLTDSKYRENVLQEVQLLISQGVKHENLLKILEVFR